MTKFISDDNLHEIIGSDQEPSTVYYDSSGRSSSEETEESAAAVIQYSNNVKYLVKTAGGGNKIFHPRQDNLLKRDSRKKGNDAFAFTFTEVDRRCFAFYLDFLTTGNDYQYTQATMAKA